jgi:cyanate permease
MSAGADDPARAASRVSVIASIGYCAFLTGPPLIGFLGQEFTVLRGLTAVAVLLAVAALVAGNVRPLAPADPPQT